MISTTAKSTPKYCGCLDYSEHYVKEPICENEYKRKWWHKLLKNSADWYAAFSNPLTTPDDIVGLYSSLPTFTVPGNKWKISFHSVADRVYGGITQFTWSCRNKPKPTVSPITRPVVTKPIVTKPQVTRPKPSVTPTIITKPLTTNQPPTKPLPTKPQTTKAPITTSSKGKISAFVNIRSFFLVFVHQEQASQISHFQCIVQRLVIPHRRT